MSDSSAGVGQAPRAPRKTFRPYRVEFPPPGEDEAMGQDEAFFSLIENGRREKIRFHDYGEIYRRPGLYEQLFYDRLKCQSPRKVAGILHSTLEENGDRISELRVLDMGAGNGMAGAALGAYGFSRLVGVDIVPEARESAYRDRPGLYDHYYVTDLGALDPEERTELEAWSFNCFVTVAALGFGDIPPRVLMEGFELVEDRAWIAFNIKETFLDRTDVSGFSRVVRELIFSDYLELHHLERYRHRLAIDGTPLYYYAVVVRKTGRPLPEGFLAGLDG